MSSSTPPSGLVALASRFTVAGLIRMLTTVGGLVITAEAPRYSGQQWFDVAIAVAAGLGIYAVHNPPAARQGAVTAAPKDQQASQ